MVNKNLQFITFETIQVINYKQKDQYNIYISRETSPYMPG